MKTLILAAGFLTALGMGALNKDATPVAPEDRYCVVNDKSADLKFKINQATADNIELALNEGQGNQNVFFQFGFGAGWGSGKSALILKGLDEKSKIKGTDLSKVGRFAKDDAGKPVNFYPLRNTLVEGSGGKLYIQMSYIGAAMPLLDELIVEKAVSMPKSINNRLGADGTVQFLPGAYKIDKSINGFRVAVKML